MCLDQVPGVLSPIVHFSCPAKYKKSESSFFLAVESWHLVQMLPIASLIRILVGKPGHVGQVSEIQDGVR